MLGRRELWSVLEELLAEEGLQLFDLDLPSGSAGTLRIYISRPKAEGVDGEGGVNVEDCALVSRKVAAHESLGQILELYSLEVSSPGINRRLQLPVHFEGAVGERVRVALRADASGKPATVVGVLTRYADETLFIAVEVERSGQSPSTELAVPLANVREAKVEFSFDEA